ncbi:MAG: hypothetical protein HYX75_08765 [Acidobacteria bacterium]|nr:hypothetical protein [Acidobacteriota bacterium]
MRYAILLVVALVGMLFAGIAGCMQRQGTAPAPELANLVADIERAGFFKYAPSSKRPDLREEILKSGFLFPEGTRRVYGADAEDLAEQGVMAFVSDISPFLRLQGINIPLREEKRGMRRVRNPQTGDVTEMNHVVFVVDDKIPGDPAHPFLTPLSEELPESGDYYRVTMGHHIQEIWNRSMSASQYWEAGMCHTFILINWLLQEAGSSERVFGLYGGNDGSAVFLTQSEFEMIRDSPAVKESDKPWEPYEVKAK